VAECGPEQVADRDSWQVALCAARLETDDAAVRELQLRRVLDDENPIIRWYERADRRCLQPGVLSINLAIATQYGTEA
jgi:hypothetical protein